MEDAKRGPRLLVVETWRSSKSRDTVNRTGADLVGALLAVDRADIGLELPPGQLEEVRVAGEVAEDKIDEGNPKRRFDAVEHAFYGRRGIVLEHGSGGVRVGLNHAG